MTLQIGYKGFDSNFIANGYQFATNYVFTFIEPCDKVGFNFSTIPDSVLNEFPPFTSRYAKICILGKVSRVNDNDQFVTDKIFIIKELSFKELLNDMNGKYILNNTIYTYLYGELICEEEIKNN